MSRPSEQGSAHPEDGDPHRPPNVYVPQAPQPPVYDAYADPAAAHGWQDTAYDDTAQLPPVAADAPAQRSGHRGRHRPLGLRSRRVMIAAGAAGAVSVAAVIAAFSFSGPSGGVRVGPERTGATVGDSESPTGAESSAGALADRPGSSGAASPRKSASPSATATADVTGGTRESSTAATSAAPPSSAATNTSAAAPSYSRDHPGKGQGNTKKPD